MTTIDKSNWLNHLCSLFLKVGASREVALFISCQFALESDFGRSRLAQESNNYCGMKSPILRPSFNLNPARTFASFESLDFCVQDYLNWLCWNKCSIAKLQDIRSFRQFLRDKKYCPETDYIDNINYLYSQFTNLLTP